MDNSLAAERGRVIARRFPHAPDRIARLPLDRRGFPVPWFVSWRDGLPQFPVVDAAKLGLAWSDERCWVCGERLGVHRSWVMGPMSVIEGATPEPPSHHDCATFAAEACPHLTTDARYSDNFGAADGYAQQGNISKIRSAATAIWVTRGRGATPFRAGGGILFKLDDPARLEWYAHGGKATDVDVRQAIAAVLPTLRLAAEADRREAEFERRLRWLEAWAPPSS
jgi:hypothetical protein